MKKANAAPAPPVSSRPLSGGSSLTGDSDSASCESGLEGQMKLNVVLPDGAMIQTEVERRTAMMDLLVQITKAQNLNPGSYALEVKSLGDITVSYKPNTPIGTLGVTAVHVVPRTRDPNSIHRDAKSGIKPFETTFRLRVHLPRNQLHVLRVSPRMPLADVFETICSEKGLNPSRYELRHPIHDEVQLDHSRCLADYDLSEVSLIAIKEGNTAGSMKHLDTVGITSVSSQEPSKKKHGILSFMFKKSKQNSGVDLNVDTSRKPETASVYRSGTRSASPSSTMMVTSTFPTVSSTSDMSTTSNKSVKKRPAPAPPPHHSRQTSLPSTMTTLETTRATMTTTTTTKSTATGNELRDGLTTFTATHSRHSSDSSGYHESSILSDSPEISGADLECSSVHFKGRKAISTTNIHLIDSTSSFSVVLKKRKAPPPPPRSSTLPPPTTTTTPTTNNLLNSASETMGLSNGSLESSTISRKDSSSSRSSSVTEITPVPKPRVGIPPMHSPQTDTPLIAATSDVLEFANGNEVQLMESQSNLEEITHEVSMDSPLKIEDDNIEATIDPLSATSTLSRHSSNNSIYIMDKVDLNPNIKITTADVHDENLKNTRKSSVGLLNGSMTDSKSVYSDGEMTIDSPEVDEVFRPIHNGNNEEEILTDAINEFHNETDSVKLNLTELWSHVVTLPPGDVDSTNADRDSPTEVENDDNLSIVNGEYFDMPSADNHRKSNEVEDISANRIDIYPDNPESNVNGLLDEPCGDVMNNISKLNPEPEENDLVLTWEYRIPEVPVEFQNDTKNEETPGPLPVTNKINTESLTTVYTSKVDKKTTTSNDRVQVEDIKQDPPVQMRFHSRKPIVQFSISTYSSRRSEETNYQDKLVRFESFNETLQTERHSVVKSESKTEPAPGQSSSITKKSEKPTNGVDDADSRPLIKRAQSELKLNSDSAEPVKEEQQLKEEYSKLHQQFIQWQKQLLNNQNLLQKQQVLSESTTTPLRPLQEFQDQFRSLPPNKTEKPSTVLQNQPQVVTTLIKEVGPHKSSAPVVAQNSRPSRPVSVNVSSWIPRPSSNGVDSTLKGPSTEELKEAIERRSCNQRVTSFNDHSANKRPIVTINRQTSHAALFPRNPVVYGFATLPPNVTLNNSTKTIPTTIQDNPKKCLKTFTYFGDNCNQVSNQPEVERPMRGSQIHPNSNYKPDVAASSSTQQVNGNSKFSTVVSVGRAPRQQVTSSAPPPPPPPPPPPLQTQSKLKSNDSHHQHQHQQQQRKTTNSSMMNTVDTRDELMSAIRDFGGRFGLKKVSDIETRWQSRHGNVAL